MTLTALLVEDDQDLADSICEYLRLKSISVEHASNGTDGLKMASNNQYDVLLLDLMLPGLDGLSLCRELRSQGIKTPVLMLTARDTLDDKVAGFTAGSDDYLVKPFALEELTVRVKSLARWHSGQVRTLQVEDLQLDLDNRKSWRQQQPLKLSPTGFILLEILMRASPAIVTRETLEQAIWSDEPPDTNALKVHLYHLRKQVDKSFSQPLIHTLPGKGYVLKQR